MKIIHSDTSDRSNHINCFKHIKYMTTAAVLTAGLFITGCGSSHAMNTNSLIPEQDVSYSRF